MDRILDIAETVIEYSVMAACVAVVVYFLATPFIFG